MNPPDAATLERLRSAIVASSVVRLAVLFGSQAAGTARHSSGVDIGIGIGIGILPRDPGLSRALAGA
jgi:predicted nucleotidyltransferase